jgi:hypothetical protein
MPKIVRDQDRDSVRGLTTRDFDHIGTSTLRHWLSYWRGVEAGTQRLTPGSADTVDAAPAEIAKLEREIEAREADGYAGPNRHRRWP